MSKTSEAIPYFASIVTKFSNIFKSGGLLNNAICTGVLGSWLIFLYVASSWLVVYAFSAHQLNNAITNVEKIEGVQLTRWQIKKIYLEWAPQQAKVDVINDAILKNIVSITWDMTALCNIASVRF